MTSCLASVSPLPPSAAAFRSAEFCILWAGTIREEVGTCTGENAVTVGTCAAASAAAAEQRAPAVVLMVSGYVVAIVAMVMTIGYELIYLDREIAISRRYEAKH